MTKVGFRCPACNAVLNVSTQDVLAPSDSEFLSKRIDEVDWGKGFNARIVRALEKSKPPIVMIADLIKRDERELLFLPNFFERSLAQVQRTLRAQGYQLQSDPDYWRG